MRLSDEWNAWGNGLGWDGMGGMKHLDVGLDDQQGFERIVVSKKSGSTKLCSDD